MIWLGGIFFLIAAWIVGSYFVKGVIQWRLNYVMIGLFILWTVVNSLTVVPAGHVGVKDLFGIVSDNVLHPGLRIVNPLLVVHKMSTRTQEVKETAEVPSSEGLMVKLDVSLLFNLNPKNAPSVYRTLGMDYLRIFVEPQLRSHLRGVTASYEAKALYTSERELIAARILQDLNPAYEKAGFINAAILLREIKLPALVSQAIEEKVKAEQEAQRMVFVLQKEQQEAERKRIEARGIRDFQQTVSEGISPQLLKWKGIEATENLAKSENAKIVVIGGADGLPLILNTKD